jgi:hypothetical protein
MDMAREHVTNYWEQLGIGTAAAMVSALAAEGLINAIIRLKNKSLQQEKIAAGKKVEPLTTRERIAGFVYGFACGSPWAVKRGQMVEGKDIAVAMGGYQTYVLARSGLVAFGAGEVANSWPVAAGVATFLGWCATVGATHDTLGQETGLGRKIDTALHWTQRTIAGVDDTGRKRFERKLAGAEAFEINPDHAGRRAKIAQAVLDHRLSRVA